MQENLPPLPEMKPIPYVPSEPVERPMPQSRPMNPPALPIGPRLRQLLGMMFGGGIVLTLLIGLLQVIAAPEWRPSTLIANFEAGVERAMFNQKMGVPPGSLLLTEGDYREKLANAERKGQATAELAFQKQMALVETDKQRVLQAYGTLYQRTNMMAQGAVQLEGQAQQFRQQLLMESSGVKTGMIQLKDLGCQLGLPGACEAAKADRENLISESDHLSDADVAKKVNELMQGIEDPASLAVHRDQLRASTFGAPSQP